ncbi:MAG: hypothetical protein HKN43_02600 [Rhodothermales bacterium]|nr:hypothetical protein [Rhodothermales bacterium]
MTVDRHIDDLLNDYFDDELSSETRRSFDDHIATCERCSSLIQQMDELTALVGRLPESISPSADLWSKIESRITPDNQSNHSPRILSFKPVIGLAIAAALAVSFVIYILISPTQQSWEVMPVAGEPTIDNVTLSGQSSLAKGQTITTNETSRAAVSVGNIGTVDILPETTIQVVSATTSDHRFRMSAGTIHASITAPPRLFFVETPAALAIDLGCEYTLRVDSLGWSHLDVSLGYVELEHPGRSSIVPEGYRAIAVPGVGPTVAVDTDASDRYMSFVVEYTLFKNMNALDSLLTASTSVDAVTLWLILEKHSSDLADSRQIYQRIVELVGQPDGVSFDETVINRNALNISEWQDHLGLDLTLMSFEAASKKKRFLKSK